ncbi:MlaD family protein [Nocardia neocaledoniensis]|uniref:MlaD family protein n=1 Tax=Nocardia neocaledoniensis TaxID=236511 RepID=UPI0024571917|nr:MlaD family protein [Nocardia neocaledoniensis]
MMVFSARTRSGIGAFALCGVVFATSSCSVGPNDLPVFRGTPNNGYDVTLEFASVMNLPAGAHVMMDGLKVGAVDAVDLAADSVRVTVTLDGGTQVPTDVRAVIRQNTLLGDTYIGLDRPFEGATGAFLSAGSTVPVERTSSPPQLEDTIAVLAHFVNGGSIQRVQEAMSKINTVMPEMLDLQHMASTVAVDLRDLAGNTGEIDRFLEGLDATAQSVNNRSDIVSTVFTDNAVHFWYRWAHNIVGYVSKALPAIGSIFEGGLWMVPMLESLADTASMGRGIWDDAPTTAAKLSEFLRLTLLPFVENPSINVLSVESAKGDQMIADVENVLRMLGAVK